MDDGGRATKPERFIDEQIIGVMKEHEPIEKIDG